MSVEIISLGHNTGGGSDKIWGAAVATNPDGSQTGFRFWGAREKPLKFKVCNGDASGQWGSLLALWRRKNSEGYEEVNYGSLDAIERDLGPTCRNNISQMITSIMLLGVGGDLRTTA